MGSIEEILNKSLAVSERCNCSELTIEDYSVTYAAYNFILMILLLPLVSMCGIFTNLANVFIYSRPQMRNSSNYYLAALACSDFFVVLTGLFIFWIDSARSYIPSLKYAPYCIVYTLPIGYAAQMCSVYFTVFAAVDCYVKVCWTPFSQNWSTMRQAKKVVLVTVMGSVAYNALRFGQFQLQSCIPENETVSIIEICPTKLFFQVNTVYNVYMYMVLMTFLPFLLLSILNALIVNRVKGNSPTEERAASDVVPPSSDDVITMIMVVVMFLCCNILALIVNIVETFFDPGKLILNYLTDTSNFLVMFNSSVNFVIYMIFSADFLYLFYEQFSCRRRKFFDRSVSHNAEGSNGGEIPLTNGGSYSLVPTTETRVTASKEFCRRNNFSFPNTEYTNIGSRRFDLDEELENLPNSNTHDAVRKELSAQSSREAWRNNSAPSKEEHAMTPLSGYASWGTAINYIDASPGINESILITSPRENSKRMV